MPRLPPDHISDFVRTVMPESATVEELRYAQSRLDDYLDVIDAIHARLMREEFLDSRRDKNDARDMVESIDNEA